MAILIPARFSHATRAGPLRDGQVLRLAGETMGTCWSVQCVARAPGMLDALRCGIDTVLADLVAQLSHWQADSAVCRYNRAPAGSRHPLPTDFARVLDAGTTPSGNPYFVMELVDGVPLTEYCDTRKLSIRKRLHLMVEICNAIQHAHQKGIIHRDLKPTNVLITEHDGEPVVKIIDFGVAKATQMELTEKHFDLQNLI